LSVKPKLNPAFPAEYGQGLQDALQAGGFLEQEATDLANQAEQQRLQFNLLEDLAFELTTPNVKNCTLSLTKKLLGVRKVPFPELSPRTAFTAALTPAFTASRCGFVQSTFRYPVSLSRVSGESGVC
jgi:hypothetical protein